MVLELGFDRSTEEEGQVRVRCSQCAAVVINGVPCHEQGCPNVPRPEPDEDYPWDDPSIELDTEWDDDA